MLLNPKSICLDRLVIAITNLAILVHHDFHSCITFYKMRINKREIFVKSVRTSSKLRENEIFHWIKYTKPSTLK